MKQWLMSTWWFNWKKDVRLPNTNTRLPYTNNFNEIFKSSTNYSIKISHKECAHFNVQVISYGHGPFFIPFSHKFPSPPSRPRNPTPMQMHHIVQSNNLLIKNIEAKFMCPLSMWWRRDQENIELITKTSNGSKVAWGVYGFILFYWKPTL